MKWIGIAMTIALLASCTTAPDPAAKGAQLMAQLKTASGGARLDTLTTYHMAGTRVRTGPGIGTINGSFEDCGDFRTGANTGIETFAGKPSTGGYNGKLAWHLGPDGKAQVDAAERLPCAKLNTYLNTQAYFFPKRFPATFEYRGRQEADGKSFDVVAVTPEGTMTINFWLDLKTHRLARLSGSNGQANITGVIVTERNYDGVWFMSDFVQTMQAGPQTFTETSKVQTYTFGPVPPERLRMPP